MKLPQINFIYQSMYHNNFFQVLHRKIKFFEKLIRPTIAVVGWLASLSPHDFNATIGPSWTSEIMDQMIWDGRLDPSVVITYLYLESKEADTAIGKTDVKVMIDSKEDDTKCFDMMQMIWCFCHCLSTVKFIFNVAMHIA